MRRFYYCCICVVLLGFTLSDTLHCENIGYLNGGPIVTVTYFIPHVTSVVIRRDPRMEKIRSSRPTTPRTRLPQPHPHQRTCPHLHPAPRPPLASQLLPQLHRLPRLLLLWLIVWVAPA